MAKKRVIVAILLILILLMTNSQMLAKLGSSPIPEYDKAMEDFEYLDGLRERGTIWSWFMDPYVSMTIGRYVYVSKEKWTPINLYYFSERAHSILIHENFHARRQQERGVNLWIWKYCCSKKFRFEEEKLAFEAEFRYLIVECGWWFDASYLKEYAKIMSEEYGGMIDYENALEYVTALRDKMEEELYRDTKVPKANEFFVPQEERN